MAPSQGSLIPMRGSTCDGGDAVLSVQEFVVAYEPASTLSIILDHPEGVELHHRRGRHRLPDQPRLQRNSSRGRVRRLRNELAY